jgi:hypothetical protein
MTGFAHAIAGGEGILITDSVHSPNYIPGVSGWTINKDGSAEFNDLDIRGAVLSSTLTAGNTIVINQDGLFVYNGPTRGLTPPANSGGSVGGATGTIPNTCTASLSGGESGQVWTKVSDDGISTAVFQAVA